MRQLRNVLQWATAHPAVAALAAVAASCLVAAAGLLRPVLAIALVAAAVVLLRRAPRRATPTEAPAPLAAPARARPPGSRVAAAAILLVFGAVGAGALVAGLHVVYTQEAALLDARAVPATVIAVAMVEPRARRRGGFSYRPAVRHRYVVDGRPYESDRLYPLAEHLDARHAAALLAMYRPGQRVFTLVPAHDPATAYLAPKRRWALYGLLPFGLAFLLPAVLGGRWLLGRKRGTHGGVVRS